ncbi:hypothetical protein FPANT_7252 [Fusarium pseudoanthophilum]|uniref:Fucose-specific lectin n=1 Tax=Fusarium pseudoanthophilum TaxID=48495 RepID=A0A8H5L9N6_9HYPO|nr:hypothetical protein FPANT_7252 [Fusarium pseudoanthophilum]
MTISDINFISDGYDANDVRYSCIRGVTTTETHNLQTYAAAFKTLPPTEWSAIDAVAVALSFLAYSTNDSRIPEEPSRCFLYFNARDVLDLTDKEKDWKVWPANLGNKKVNLRTVLQGLNTFGVLSEDNFSWPSPTEKPYPRRSHYSQAEKSPLFNVLRLDYDTTEGVTEPDVLRAIRTQILYRVRQCLSEGTIVMFAFHFYWPTFETVPPASKDKEYPTIAMIPLARRGVGPAGVQRSQVVLAIDNDQANRRLLIKSNWKDSVPYFWMPYEWILDCAATEGFWTISASEAKPSRPRMWYRDGDFVHPWKDSDLVLQTPSTEGIGNFQNSNIAVLPRGDNILDVFWVNPAGRIVVGHYNKNQEIPRWRFAFVSDAGTATGSVAAIRPWPKDFDDRMEVFSITKNGYVFFSWVKVGNEEDPNEWKWEHDWMRDGPKRLHDSMRDWSKAVTEGCIVVTQPPTDQWKCKVFWVQPDGCLGTAYDPLNVDGDRGWSVSSISRMSDGSTLSLPTPKSSLATVSIAWEEDSAYWAALWWIDGGGYLRGLWVASFEVLSWEKNQYSLSKSHMRMQQESVPPNSRLSAAQSIKNHYVTVFFQNSRHESYAKSNESKSGNPYPDDKYSHDIPVDEGSYVKAVACENFWEAYFITAKPDRKIAYRWDRNGRPKQISEHGCLPDSTIMEQSQSHLFVKLHDGILGILDLS